MTRARLQVLVVTPWYPGPEDPVSGVFVREQVRAVSPQVVPVVVHLRRHPAMAPVRVTVEGGGTQTLVLRVDGLLHRSGALLSVLALPAVWWHLRKRGVRPDLVHCHVLLAGVLSMLLAWVLRTPYVVTEHSMVFLPASGEPPLTAAQRAFVRVLLRGSRVVLPVSDALRAALQAEEPSATYRVVPNAVDEAVFFPAEAGTRVSMEPRRLLVVANLVGYKRVDDALRLLAALRSEDQDVELAVVGEGPDRPRLLALAERLGVASHVVWYGRRDKPDVAGLMREADLLLVLSRVETFAVVVAEALMCGTRVLATRCGGPEELVLGERGALVEVGDVTGATAAARRLLHTGYDHVALARDAAHEFGSARVGRELLAVYEGALRA